jgi:hypothetical protein
LAAEKKGLPELDEETIATIYAFFTHALHHPLEETALPPNARPPLLSSTETHRDWFFYRDIQQPLALVEAVQVGI